ncbi:MAG: glycoside hydrolase family 2 TIM barrel-domain containing protein [Chthoniobacteraceae bacterium]
MVRTFITTPTLATNAGASSTVDVKTEIRNDNATAQNCTVSAKIIDPGGNIVGTVSTTQTIAANTTVTIEQTTPEIANPQLWSPGSPTMYHALVTVSNGSTAVDDFDTRFGFRWIQWTAEQGFYLNGTHFYFHGANVHQDHAGWGDGTTNAGFYRDVQMVKDAGFNFIRGSHYPKDPAFGDACDDIGVLFWSENCFWGIGGTHTEGNWLASAYPTVATDQAPFEQNVLATLTDMIRIHRNHPSVIAWSLSNEAFFSDSSVMTNMRNLLSSEVALVHQLDSTRPAAIGGAQRPLDSTRIDKLGDVAGYNGDGATQSVFQDPGVANVVTEYGSPVATRPGSYDPAFGTLPLTNGFPTEYAWRSGQSIWCMFDHGSFAGTNLETMGIVDYFRLPKRAWYWYRNAYAGIAPPTWPVAGTATQLGLDADKTTLSAVDGTDDALLRVSILDASGNRLSNTATVTLTIESGPGEFPTGRTITFTPPGNGDSSDIAIRDGWAAIEFRAYQAGTSVIRATSTGLTDATITITSQGSPAFVSGTTPLVAARPYTRFTGTVTQPPVSSLQLALNRPALVSSSAPGTTGGLANDGDTSTIWQATSTDSNPWWLVQLEETYQINRIQITFPTAGNWRYKIDVSTGDANFVTVVDQSQTTNTDQTRVATGNFGSGIGIVRIRFFGVPTGQTAGLAEVSVGGGSGLTFNNNQLGGTIIGTTGSYGSVATATREAAMDGDTSTYFDAPAATGAWVGLDLGSNTTASLARVRYCPRPESNGSNFAARMVGGKFQGANQPDFSDAVDLFTIATTPTTATYTTQEITNAGAYRYVRYLSPASGSCNVAELEFYANPGTGAITRYAFENNATDSSGNGNNGTASGVTYVTGKVGTYAANFNGTTAYVGSSLTTAGDFSVALWVKTTSASSSGTSSSQWWAGKGLVDGDVSGNAADWGTSITNGKFAFGIGASTSSSTDVTVFSSTTINDNAWHHCVATWTESTGAMAVYVDGIASGTGTGGAGIPRLSPITLKLGRTASGSGNVSLNGALDEVRFYNRVLSSTEVAALAALTAPTSLPATPTGLAATPGDGQVALSWSASSGATAYLIERSTTSGSGYAIIGTTSGASYVDLSVLDGTTYYYVIVASNLAGNSASSSGASALPVAVPTAPTAVTASAVSSTSIQLNWTDAATNETSYQVDYSLSGANAWTSGSVLAANSTSSLVSGLSVGTSYDFRVKVTNSGGTSYTIVTQTTLTAYQQWKVSNGLSASTVDTATPDGDNISILMKYATGMTPGQRGTNPVTMGQSAGGACTLAFKRVSPAPVTYTVMASSDLVMWTAIATLAKGSDTWSGPAGIAEPASGSPRTVTVTDTVTTLSNPRRFLRLVVTP